MLQQQLTTLLAQTDIALTEKQQQQLVRYVELLDKWNKAYNLTSVRLPQEMMVKHIMDSLVVAPHLPGHHYIDVGTGPGLPGIVLAIALPNTQFVLLDSLGKQVFPEWLNIEERPLIKSGLASSSFDNEGVSCSDMTIVDSGQLATYLYTTYSARKLNTVSNGHAGGIHNWLVGDTGHSDADLLKEMGTGSVSYTHLTLPTKRIV